jgi:hypothetical protein
MAKKKPQKKNKPENPTNPTPPPVPDREDRREIPDTGGFVDYDRVDSYTGEIMPPFPEGDIPLDDIDVETYANVTDILPFDEADSLDYIAIDRAADADFIEGELDDFTDDEETLADFAERQHLASGSDEQLLDLLEHNSQSPILSGGDIDAAWEDSIVSGEESAGGTVATPDQDVVDEIGQALGIEYEDGEELDTADKLEQRDQHRWELDPRSQDEERDEEEK